VGGVKPTDTCDVGDLGFRVLAVCSSGESWLS
jgi:hypothetical protein